MPFVFEMFRSRNSLMYAAGIAIDEPGFSIPMSAAMSPMNALQL